MSLDPRVKRFLSILAAGNPHSVLQTSVAQRREALAELLRLGAPDLPIGWTEGRMVPGPAGALPVRIYTPAEEPARLIPGIVYFHGGGLVAGSVATHESIARALASSGACRIVSVEYRLAPEHPFPAALEDCLAALRHVGANAADFGIDAAR